MPRKNPGGFTMRDVIKEAGFRTRRLGIVTADVLQLPAAWELLPLLFFELSQPL